MSKLSSKAHTPEFPFAKFCGVLSLGGKELDAYVLSNEERVLSMRGMVRAFTQVDQGIVGENSGGKSRFTLGIQGFFRGEFSRISHSRKSSSRSRNHRRTVH